MSTDSESKVETVDNKREPVQIVFNMSFSKNLRRLELRAIEIQYQLACLSTLGGAYHLCNNPTTALIIARKQEIVGRILGSSAVILRSKVFQAVNHGLLGNSDQLFIECKKVASNNLFVDMLGFIEASEIWLAGVGLVEHAKCMSYDRLLPV